jgi:predicted ATPase/DNA-binding XRE family transcriptional regulator
MTMSTWQPSGTPTFAELLRHHRIAAALSQEALAERAGLSERAISDLERGVKTGPYLETVRSLADALNLTLPERVAFAAAARPAASPLHVPASPLPSPLASTVLPVPPTPLVGRETDVVESVRRLSAGEARLLTLTGPGGVGKTRLALEVARQLSDHYPDGIAWVDLAPLADPSLVTGTIAHMLGVREDPGRSLVETLRNRLRNKHFLLVLDNCEHVRQSVGALAADLLTDSAGLVIMATSRALLHLAAEQNFQVEPLGLPDPNTDPLAADVAEAPAVRLFVQRAHAVRPDFSLTEANAADVARICRRLDGLPLAIELAAARTRLLSPAALWALLEERLWVLTGGSEDLPERQRRIRDTIVWSHDLLSPAQQVFFRQLAVFAGGFTLEAATAVAAEGDPFLALDGLEELVDQSLVRPVDLAGDSPRFGMLETVHEFATEQLQDGGDSEDVRRRPAEYLATLSKEAKAEETSLPPAGRNPIGPERDNVRAALRWCLETGNAELGLRLAGNLWESWFRWGDLSEARGLIAALLALPGAETHLAVWAKASGAAGALAQAQGDHDQAVTLSEQSLAASRAVGDRGDIASALYTLGLEAMVRGQYEQATAYLEESRTQFAAAADRRVGSWALRHLSSVLYRRGRMHDAASLAEEGLAVARNAGSSSEIAGLLHTLGLSTAGAGDLDRAATLWDESLRLFEENGDRWGVANALGSLGWVAYHRADFDSAEAHLGNSLKLYEEVGDPEGVTVLRTRLGWLARAKGNLPRGSELFEQSIALALKHDNPSTLAPALHGAGTIALDLGQRSRAATLWQEALVLAREYGELETVASVLEWYAHLAVPERGAWGLRLLENAAALRRVLGEATPPLDKEEHDAIEATLRSSQDAPAGVNDAAQRLEADFELALGEIISSVLATDIGA